MKFGSLADFFVGAGAKVLSEVEVNSLKSNQHEFQGIDVFRTFLGAPSEKKRLSATYIWLDDSVEGASEKIDSFGTWSDVRRQDPKRDAEYRLYYPVASEPVVRRAKAGDILIIAYKNDGSILVLLTPSKSTIAQQILWLFGLDLAGESAELMLVDASAEASLSWASRKILSELGVEIEPPEPGTFEKLISKYGARFPPTAEFSQFARNSVTEADPLGAPDEALLAWMEQEEALFRHLEKFIVEERLKTGFVSGGQADVDGFLAFSLSVQNRRKSRAGYAFAHHTEAILKARKIRYTREATTEKRNAADFLFPGEAEYRDPEFAAANLRMLAVKTTLKDRWRQVLAEADRIPAKHLLTVEPAISVAQTDEMRGQGLQLVVPSPLHTTFRSEQARWLLSFADFLKLVS